MSKKIYVHVIPNSGKQEIEDFGNWRYLVYVKSPAENNEANIETLKLLGRYLGIPSTKLKIVSGATSKDKIVEIQY